MAHIQSHPPGGRVMQAGSVRSIHARMFVDGVHSTPPQGILQRPLHIELQIVRDFLRQGATHLLSKSLKMGNQY